MQSFIRMFQRPLVAVTLAGLIGCVLEGIALYSLSAILSWCWDKLCAYWQWFLLILKVVLFLGIGIVLGVFFFAESLSRNEKLLNTVLDVGDVALSTSQHALGVVLGTIGSLLKHSSTEVELPPSYNARRNSERKQQSERSSRRNYEEEEE